MAGALLGLVLLATSPVLAAAPREAPSPWLPFLGCWQEAEAPQGQPMTCIVPVTDSPFAADLLVVRDGTVLRGSRLLADGTVAAVSSEDCRGQESTRFSQDGSRVYLRGDLSCGGAAPVQANAMFALSAGSRLIHVRGRANEADPAIAARVLDAVPWRQLPQAVRASLEPHGVAVLEQRLVVSRTVLTADAIVETVQGVGAPISEIWLAAVAADAPIDIELDEATRRSLSEGGVPMRVVALLEALDDPRRYEIALSETGARVRPTGVMTEGDVQRLIYRIAGSGAMGSSTPLGPGSISAASICMTILEMHAGLGGPYAIGFFGVDLNGAHQAMLAGRCGEVMPLNLRTTNAVYGSYQSTPPAAAPRPPREPIDPGLRPRSQEPATSGAARTPPDPGLRPRAPEPAPSTPAAPSSPRPVRP